MTQFNHYLYPINEVHVRLYYDGEVFHLDGMPEGREEEELPEYYKRGVRSIFNLLESMLPALSCIGLMGVWFGEEDENPLVVFSIWVQQENEGFYLQMGTAATLLRENGIPYFHKPII